MKFWIDFAHEYLICLFWERLMEV